MPREQAFTAAQRLQQSGVPREALLAELRRLGFKDAEAKLAVHALQPAGEASEERWRAEELRRARVQTGYLRLLLAFLLLVGGALLAVATGSLFGVGAGLLGLALLGAGLWALFRSQVG